MRGCPVQIPGLGWCAHGPNHRLLPHHFKLPDGGAVELSCEADLSKVRAEKLGHRQEWGLWNLPDEAKPRWIPSTGDAAQQRLEDLRRHLWDAHGTAEGLTEAAKLEVQDKINDALDLLGHYWARGGVE